MFRVDNFLVQKVQNAEVSDTTEGDSRGAVCSDNLFFYFRLIKESFHEEFIACLSYIFYFFRSSAQQKTFCNPINIDYGYTPIPNFSEQGRHRATADPVITLFKGNYYLFSTNQWGYWWSSDMLNWKFVSRKFLKPLSSCVR